MNSLYFSQFFRPTELEVMQSNTKQKKTVLFTFMTNFYVSVPVWAETVLASCCLNFMDNICNAAAPHKCLIVI